MSRLHSPLSELRTLDKRRATTAFFFSRLTTLSILTTQLIRPSRTFHMAYPAPCPLPLISPLFYSYLNHRNKALYFTTLVPASQSARIILFPPRTVHTYTHTCFPLPRTHRLQSDHQRRLLPQHKRPVVSLIGTFLFQCEVKVLQHPRQYEAHFGIC